LVSLQLKAFSSSYSAKIKDYNNAQNQRKPVTTFSVNDQVLYHSTFGHARPHKLDTLWKGPFTVITIVDRDVYSIKDNVTS
jgi:hypothetical protein